MRFLGAKWPVSCDFGGDRSKAMKFYLVDGLRSGACGFAWLLVPRLMGWGAASAR